MIVSVWWDPLPGLERPACECRGRLTFRVASDPEAESEGRHARRLAREQHITQRR